MDRSDRILDWWEGNGGRLQDMGDVLPYVVCDAVPADGDVSTVPLLVGAESFQAKLLDTVDPRVLREELTRQQPEIQRKAVEDRLAVLARWEPEISFVTQSWLVNGRPFQMQYVRLLAPVKTTKGAQMLITHTAECAVN